MTMKYRSLGASGLKVSLFGLGGWTTFGGTIADDKLIKSILYAAFEAGVNFFDIADIYAKGESERMMGSREVQERSRCSWDGVTKVKSHRCSDVCLTFSFSRRNISFGKSVLVDIQRRYQAVHACFNA